MKLSVRNANDLELTKLIKLAVNFYAESLLEQNIIKDLQISISIQYNFKNGGVCLSIDNRTFKIEIAHLRKTSSMLKTLAHEMAHVKQYAKKELYETSDKTYWHGKIIDAKYWDQPWEIEAYGLEMSLFAKFLIKYNLFKQLKERRNAWYMEC